MCYPPGCRTWAHSLQMEWYMEVKAPPSTTGWCLLDRLRLRPSAASVFHHPTSGHRLPPLHETASHEGLSLYCKMLESWRIPRPVPESGQRLATMASLLHTISPMPPVSSAPSRSPGPTPCHLVAPATLDGLPSHPKVPTPHTWSLTPHHGESLSCRIEDLLPSRIPGTAEESSAVSGLPLHLPDCERILSMSLEDVRNPPFLIF